MPAFLLPYFITYGYLAIFCIILLQELGMPGLPNELVLFYFGYISREATLVYPIVIVLVITADMLGSISLFLIFYHGRKIIASISPKWIRLPVKKLVVLRNKLKKHNGRNILLAKLTPFVRGYLPVAAGLLKIDTNLYARVIAVSAVVWSGGWVTAGWLLYVH